MRVLGIDPGKVTGMAYLNTEDGLPLVVTQEPCWQAVATIERGIEAGGIDVLVVESFTVSAATLRKSRGEYWSLESIGALRYLACHRRLDGPEFIMQSPSEAMSFATDAKLRAVGWWTVGKEHGRDATRHVLTYLAKKGELPDDVRAKLREMVV